jgi:hypothetical protein
LHERLLDRFEQGEANTLIIFDVDRFSRKFTGYACLRELLHTMGMDLRGTVYQIPAGARGVVLGAERGPGIYVRLCCRLAASGVIMLEHRLTPMAR